MRSEVYPNSKRIAKAVLRIAAYVATVAGIAGIYIYLGHPRLVIAIFEDGYRARS